MLEETYHSTLDRRWAVLLIAPENAMVSVFVVDVQKAMPRRWRNGKQRPETRRGCNQGNRNKINATVSFFGVTIPLHFNINQ